MTDKESSTAMSLAGYHHLPKVTVMGRNVRTAQSKSSVKMALDLKPENQDTQLHLDGSSKIVRLLTGGSSEIQDSEMDVDNNGVAPESIMINGDDKGIDDVHVETEDIVQGEGTVDSLPVKKKRRRKKKVSTEILPSNLKIVDQSLQTSDLDVSVKETVDVMDSHQDVKTLSKSAEEMPTKKLEISGSNDILRDSLVPLKKKRGRKKKVRTSEVRTSDIASAGELSFEGNSVNGGLDTTNVNVTSSESKDNEINLSLSSTLNESDNKIRSPGTRKRVSQSSFKDKGRAESSQTPGGSSVRKYTKKADLNKSTHGQSQSGCKHMPRCVLIKPAEVPSESHLEKLKAMESASYDLQHPPLWSEGDVLWARVSGHPYWPCMVSKCPFTKMLSRIKGDVKVSRSYHVQFFGNDCERGWINEPSLMEFKGKADFLEKARLEAVKSKPVKKIKSNYNPFKVNSARSGEWNIAVEEAEAAFSLNKKERLVQYTFEYVFIDEVKKLKANTSLISSPSASSTPTAPGKRKRKVYLGNMSQGKSKAKKLKLDRSSLQVSDVPMEDNSFDSYYAKHHTGIIAQHPEWDAECVSEHLRQQWYAASPKSSRQPQLSTTPKSLNSPVLLGEKRLKKPTKKIVESLLQEWSADEGKMKTKAKVSPHQPKKRGRSKKVLQVAPQSQDVQVSVSSEVQEPTEAERIETKPKAARKMSQDSDSSSETKKRVKEIEPYELEIFKLLLTSRIEKENICSACEKNGELLECSGTCGQYFHPSCCGPHQDPSVAFKCEECTSGTHSCFSCKKRDDATKKCSVSQCGKYYHDECIRKLRFARVISESKGFVCPLHICATCAVDNVRNPKATKGRLYRCIRCPVAFHFGDFCLSAGSKNLGGSYIVCSDHFQGNKSFSQHSHVNITWCFSCSKGGSLLCCENCPASYHAECVKVDKTPDEAWYCEDCEAGKKLLYGSIVWVKVGNYRWWPGEICHPRHVPLNIQEKSHQIGEFPVRFFGSHDFYWIHRGRVFLFEEGDKASRDSSSKGLFKVYMRGVKEATEAFKLWKAAKAKREEQEQERNEKKPSQFKFIKNNVPIGNVQIYKAELSEIPHCECRYDQEEPCSSDCLNRMMMYECHPAVCPAREKCNNQRFQKRQHAQCEPFRAEGRGWGLRTLDDLKKGQFVVEYVGDLIDEEECKKRIQQSHEDNVTNFYMLTMDKNRIIDAGPKGNYSRFMNHSCCPNMETQKWMVNGDIRVGLFALCDIPKGTELVFNYNLECLGNEKTACACGSDNCSGFLGVRPKTAAAIANEKKIKELKKRRKKKKLDVKKEYEDDCFRCGEGGELVMCDRYKCPKVYHLQCLNLTKPPSGKWACPWHHCDDCGKPATTLCSECPNSYCSIHTLGNIKEVAGCQICSDHPEFLEDLNRSLEEESSCKENGLQTLSETGPCPDFRKKEVSSDGLAETGPALNHISATVNGDIERNCESPTVSDSLLNDDAAIMNEGTDNSAHDGLIIQELPLQKSQKARLSSGNLSPHKKSPGRPRGSRQLGLSRRGRRSASSTIHHTKAQYKTQMSSPLSLTDAVCKSPAICAMQKSASVQDSDDNDSISDLVIDIP